MFYTYILYSIAGDRFYIGHCENIEIRLQRHNQRMVRSTRNYVPWECVYFKTFSSKAEANQREMEIKKKKSRKYIEWLLQT
jgi:putative endonuclease